MTSTGSAPSRGDRLGGLPYTRRHTRLLVGSGVGWALDAMDVGLISFVIVVLAEQWGLTTGERSWIVTIGFIGMAIGATLGGRLADRFGRRAVFATTLVVYGLATGASALVGGVALFMVLRFFVGLGLGAELPVASTLVSELSPTRIRGRLVVALESFWAVGWILAAVIGFYVIPHGDDGWRWGLAFGLVPAVYALVVRYGLPESAAWLESRGRHEEAEEVVRGFEESAGIEPGTVARAKGEPAPVDAVTAAHGLWSAALRRRTAGIWIVWFAVNFAYYGAFLWIPSLLVARGHDVTTSFMYTLIITLAQLPGYALSAVLIEVWGRRATLAAFLVGSAVSAWFFGQSDSVTSIIVAGCALSFANLGAWGALYAITPEIYPTAVRGSGAGAAAGFGRLASILAPLMVPFLLERGGASGDVLVFSIFTAAFGVAAAATFLLPELRGRQLAE
ncbi:MFS transporter [Janibacter sp. DB-40]|uniref:MFS transporter n=1 Tax=Janibacter sp. DB-40 TaxID=3028808 RepID=UPI00240629F0|nr:MFS transporter [Janibacter sp. DB-40]